MPNSNYEEYSKVREDKQSGQQKLKAKTFVGFIISTITIGIVWLLFELL